MKYLEAALSLKSLIGETNDFCVKQMGSLMNRPNRMRLQLGKQEKKEIPMTTFSNDFVRETLNELEDPRAFVLTDITSTRIKDTPVDYILYKGYHSVIEKGLVFYQVIDKETLTPAGTMQFSNLEDNIFFQPDEPQAEESSCNVMETDKPIENGKSMVFFIGHMDEKRLVYDIQRLIFDTVNNVTRHPKLQFQFIIQIALYGGNISRRLMDQVKEIEEYTREYIYPEYPNATFQFIFEHEEDSL